MIDVLTDAMLGVSVVILSDLMVDVGVNIFSDTEAIVMDTPTISLEFVV